MFLSYLITPVDTGHACIGSLNAWWSHNPGRLALAVLGIGQWGRSGKGSLPPARMFGVTPGYFFETETCADKGRKKTNMAKRRYCEQDQLALFVDVLESPFTTPTPASCTLHYLLTLV